MMPADPRYPAPLPPLRAPLHQRQKIEDRREAVYVLALIAAYLLAIFVLFPLLVTGRLG